MAGRLHPHEAPGREHRFNLKPSRALRRDERHGGKYYASAVGEVNVVARMKEVGAVIGEATEA